MLDAIRDSGNALLRLGGLPRQFKTEPLIEDSCNDWCDESFDLLLSSADGPPEDFQVRVEKALADFDSRTFPLMESLNA